MATINFIIKKETGNTSLYVRFRDTNFDLSRSTGLMIPAEFWNQKKQRLKKTKSTPHSTKFNIILSNLKIDILNSFMIDYASGELIDGSWLERTIKNSFGRPREEVNKQKDKTQIYFTDFIQWWLDNKGNEFRNSRSRKKYQNEH